MEDRLADADILESRVSACDVRPQEQVAVRRRGDALAALGGFGGLALLRGHEHGKVGLAGLDHGRAHSRLVAEHEAKPVESHLTIGVIGLVSPPVGIDLGGPVLPLAPFHEAVRPSPYRVFVHRTGVFLDLLHGGDAAEIHAPWDQRIRCFRLHVNDVFAGRLGGNLRRHRFADMERVLRIPHPVHGEGCGFGIEGRAVMEGDAFAQREFPGRIVKLLPCGRQHRGQFSSGKIDRHELFDDVAQSRRVDLLVGLLGLHGLVFRMGRDDEFIIVLSDRRRSKERGPYRHAHEFSAQVPSAFAAPMHCLFPPSSWPA